MMKILDLYIGRVIAMTTFLTLSVLVSISGIIKFVEQMRAVGRGNYDLLDAALFAFYSVPRDVEIFFPMAALVGGLIGLGMMASNSELVVMQAAGLSKLQIIKSVMKSAAVLIVLSMAIGEFLAPQGEAKAREIRAQAISEGSLISAKNGVWAKDGELIVHITEVADTGTLKNLSMYKFSDERKMERWLSAKSASWLNEQWQLNEIEVSTFGEEKIDTEHIDSQMWQSSLTPEKLGVVTVKPEALSLQGLVSYLDYLEENKQDTSRYMLAFWRKLMQPFTVAVMLLVALSYIFGPLRSVSMGARIMMGIGTGIAYDFINRMFGSFSQTFNMPPFLGAVLPSLLFVVIAVYLLRRKV
ncbi:LPS export ABC transporter permease LptG [Thalassotalea sp. HSM 43]|uniref:LPS export ABC transporter permease LptG n=1 Tax=Thalassotalea sp. HSM 43 TaxID=2552945 RepID=UPI0010801743|nr:LPS export ABC transporter permease LptG [Thalassotalea sp. HSM 43]QBY05005.1 LPS export ABC transporter permease LptG [Thalassotalea sp. HSM 43]